MFTLKRSAIYACKLFSELRIISQQFFPGVMSFKQVWIFFPLPYANTFDNGFCRISIVHIKEDTSTGGIGVRNFSIGTIFHCLHLRMSAKPPPKQLHLCHDWKPSISCRLLTQLAFGTEKQGSSVYHQQMCLQISRTGLLVSINFLTSSHYSDRTQLLRHMSKTTRKRKTIQHR